MAAVVDSEYNDNFFRLTLSDGETWTATRGTIESKIHAGQMTYEEIQADLKQEVATFLGLEPCAIILEFNPETGVPQAFGVDQFLC